MSIDKPVWTHRRSWALFSSTALRIHDYIMTLGRHALRNQTAAGSDIILILVTIIFPPAAVAIMSGCSCDLLGYLPGHIHAFYLIWRRMEAEERYGGGYPVSRRPPLNETVDDVCGDPQLGLPTLSSQQIMDEDLSSLNMGALKDNHPGYEHHSYLNALAKPCRGTVRVLLCDKNSQVSMVAARQRPAVIALHIGVTRTGFEVLLTGPESGRKVRGGGQRGSARDDKDVVVCLDDKGGSRAN
ncbi:Pmp3 domain-containing protein [Rhizoctonia solani AG-1 IA]|uniref:Pmp3 domain-containing protein n=1 Tax=Thanatephorus cucumeris (strain AG1-IA) TaxID=983506 RepID=L8WI12_THACA|nr:Pmp3 domain-containing protein [Rhizoctonia solani AG-1 IA]